MCQGEEGLPCARGPSETSERSKLAHSAATHIFAYEHLSHVIYVRDLSAFRRKKNLAMDGSLAALLQALWQLLTTSA